MSDPSKFVTKQERAIHATVEEQKVLKGEKSPSARNKSKEKADPPFATLYAQGESLLKSLGYHLELDEGGAHCNHKIWHLTDPIEVVGIDYPNEFNVLREINESDHLRLIDGAFKVGTSCSQELRDFWTPLFRPKSSESDLQNFTKQVLKMEQVSNSIRIMEPVCLDHSFDPKGRLGKGEAKHPKIWVPDRDWFADSIKSVTLEDVFTIFPKAEIEIIRLLLGRIGVGKSNQIPSGWSKKEVVKHTARMAAVIVGKDPGLGKSTLFNGLIAAFAKCGFSAKTFRGTDDKFGMKAITKADIAYKDDTSPISLKKFLTSEETKTLITNGVFQVEEKFMGAEQLTAKPVFIVNSNSWSNNYAYDLDPGIMDRIKILTTLRESELKSKRHRIGGPVSADSPDVRPMGHLPFLANKLGVSQDALYLWCLRLATDHFWKVISDDSDPKINRLQVEVRSLTTRLRIRFKDNIIQAIVNSMAFAWCIRYSSKVSKDWEDGDGGESSVYVPELSPKILKDCLESFFFIGVDPSAQPLMKMMKQKWEEAGRPATHYYQGFREVRWESIKGCYSLANDLYSKHFNDSNSKGNSEFIKQVMEGVDTRDGFRIGAGPVYVNESWDNMRIGADEIVREGEELMGKLSDFSQDFFDRVKNTNISCDDNWLSNLYSYSPDKAEIPRTKAMNALLSKYEDRKRSQGE